MNLTLLLILAISPGILIAVYIYIRDKHEHEPVPLLALSFLYGIMSVFLALAILFPLNKLISIDESSLVGQFIQAFIFVALIEEGCKFLFIRGILYRNKNFNEPFDGIVYSVMVGMGFATVENLFYVLNTGASIAILRIFTAVPAHALFAVLMGYFLGRAKFDQRNEGLFSFMALFVAIIFHGVYNYFLFISFIPGMWILAFVSLTVAFILSKKAMEIHSDASPFKKESKEADKGD